MTKFEAELQDTLHGERLRRRPSRPTSGLTFGERKVFWRLLAACGEGHSAAVDVEEHCRNVARTVADRKGEATMSYIHINYGRARRESEPDETCMYCDRHDKVMAYTYFGAPVCGVCWDSTWRKTEDGECDPPFAEITNRNSGEWIAP